MARILGKIIGLFVYHLDKRHRKLAIANITKALKVPFTKATVIAKRSFQNLGINIVEFLIGYSGPIQVTGSEYIRRDKGNIFILGHFGNWELMGRVAVKKGIRIVAVGREIKNRFADWFIEKRRKEYGVRILDKKGSFRYLLGALRKGDSVAVLIDQYAGRRGIFVDFLGLPTSTTHSPVLLSLKTDCPVVPVFIVGRRIIVEHPIQITKDIKASTELMIKPLERYVVKYPEQWWWVHRRWRNQ